MKIMNRRTWIVITCVVLFALLFVTRQSPRERSDGILCPEAPVQEQPKSQKHWKHLDYLIEPLAKFSISARVLLTDSFRWSPASDLSPIDLTLGWQEMSDSAVLRQIELWRGNRSYQWRVATPPIPLERIVQTSANMHIVPSTERIAQKLRSLTIGDVVYLSGYLIEARKADGFHWRSSLTRSDSGGGSCELFWVEKVEQK